MRLAGQSLSENECRTATNKLKGYDNMLTSTYAHTKQPSPYIQQGLHNEDRESNNVTHQSSSQRDFLGQYEKQNKSPTKGSFENEHSKVLRSKSSPPSQQPQHYSTQL